jgi:hypothetical protein
MIAPDVSTTLAGFTTAVAKQRGIEDNSSFVNVHICSDRALIVYKLYCNILRSSFYALLLVLICFTCSHCPHLHECVSFETCLHAAAKGFRAFMLSYFACLRKVQFGENGVIPAIGEFRPP